MGFLYGIFTKKNNVDIYKQYYIIHIDLSLFLLPMLIIWWLEGVQIHPLDAKPIGNIERNTDATINSLIKCICSESILWHTQRKTPSLEVQNENTVMSNDEAKNFFWITDADIKRATTFTA